MKTNRGKKRALVLVSGGADSATALYYAAHEYELAAGLSFDYGARHNHMEIPFAEYHCKQLGISHYVIKLDFMNRFFKSALLRSGGKIPDGAYDEKVMKQTVVPFRNGIMISIAAGLAESIEAQTLIIAAHSGDHALYPDCRGEFMAHMNKAIKAGTYAHIELDAPFINMTKSRIIAQGHKLGVDFARTWSCYKGQKTHCGRCSACVERHQAFAEAGISDPTLYLSEPALDL
jgi:7-cyano-7-deazaguanine synthase